MNIFRAPLLGVLLIVLWPSMAISNDWDPAEHDGMSRSAVTQFGAAEFSEIDSISLFDGKAAFTVPLGQSYPAGGALTYNLVAHRLGSPSIERIKYARLPPPDSDQPSWSIRLPEPTTNLGAGWNVHLGRLYHRDDGADPSDATIAADKRPLLKTKWMYVSADGAQREIFGTLHGEPHMTGAFYTRDGSYIRLQEVSSSEVRIEFRSGEYHVYQWRQSWPDSAFNKDHWRLVSINDRVNNTVSVIYNADHWSISDQYGRQQYVYWENDPWYGGRVSRVELTAAHGATAVWAFHYSDHPFNRLDNNRPYANVVTHEVGILESITRPDGASYSFVNSSVSPTNYVPSGYPEIDGFTTANGLTVEYEHDATTIQGRSICGYHEDQYSGGTYTPYISRRKAYAADGTLLKDVRYSRATMTSSEIPTQYCNSWGGWQQPDTTLAVAQATQVGNSTARVDIRYFSIWPFLSDHSPYPSAGPWDTKHYGRPMKFDEVDSAGRKLTSQTYECASDLAGLPEDIVGHAQATCSKHRSAFVHMLFDYASCSEFSTNCMTRNAETSDQSTVYHDDVNKTTRNLSKESTGFGTFRDNIQQGSISNRDSRKTRTFFNPGRGVLKRNADGSIAANSSWTNVPATAPWVLNTYAFKYVEGSDGNVDHRVQACFNTNTGELSSERIIAFPTNSGSGGVGKDDILKLYSYSNGLRTQERHYGADHQRLPTANTCNYGGIDQLVTPTGPRVTYQMQYEYGVLKHAQIAGSTTTRINNEAIDVNTGFVRVARSSNGQVTETKSYDIMGRLASSSNSGGARVNHKYNVPSVNGWTGLPRIVSKQFLNGVKEQKVVMQFDELGRVSQESSSLPGGGRSLVTKAYDMRGNVMVESSAQQKSSHNPNIGTHYEYDIFDRPTSMVQADGSVVTTAYDGIRHKRTQRSVGTSIVSNRVNQSVVTDQHHFDRFGQTINWSNAEFTELRDYDGLGRLRLATRDTQQREYSYGGRGFLIRERLPELGASGNGEAVYLNFDVHGNPHRVNRGISNIESNYDHEGRLISVTDYRTQPILENTYGTSGNSNGRIVSTTRHNRFDTVSSGDHFLVETDILVEYDYSHDALGNTVARSIRARFANQPQDWLGEFEQFWSYDGKSRLETVSYPRCLTAGCADGGRSINYFYDANHLSEVVTPDGTGAVLSYHDNGQLAEIIHDNGFADMLGKGQGNIYRIDSISLAGGSPMNMQYDGSQNLISMDANLYAYDSANRLASAQLDSTGSTRRYEYDQFDNLRRIEGRYLIPDPVSNRLSNGEYEYDKEGRLIRADTTRLFYDLLGKQISQITRPSRGEISRRACSAPDGFRGPADCYFFLYGSDGERVATWSWLPGAEGDHQGESELLWTIRLEGGEVLREYVGAYDQITPKLDYIYADGRLIASRDLQSGQRKHYHLDHLWSTRVVTSGGGFLLGEREYYPYGEPLRTSDNFDGSADWAGYELSANGVSHNLHAREYFRGFGRFMTPDPARDGWNLYSYTAGNPLTRVDPDGMVCKDQGMEASGKAMEYNASSCGVGEDVVTESVNLLVHQVTGTVEHIKGESDDSAPKAIAEGVGKTLLFSLLVAGKTEAAVAVSSTLAKAGSAYTGTAAVGTGGALTTAAGPVLVAGAGVVLAAGAGAAIGYGVNKAFPQIGNAIQGYVVKEGMKATATSPDVSVTDHHNARAALHKARPSLVPYQ